MPTRILGGALLPVRRVQNTVRFHLVYLFGCARCDTADWLRFVRLLKKHPEALLLHLLSNFDLRPFVRTAHT